MRLALLRRPDPDAIEILHGSETLRVLLRRRPSARRLTLRVSSASGDVIMTLPARTSLAAAKSFAAGHSGWIAARLARIPARIPFEPEVAFPLRGLAHRIVLRSGRGTVAPALLGDEPVIAVFCEPAHVSRRIRDYLQREARRDLSRAAARYAERLGERPRRITVRDTRSRRGSCTAQGEVSFSWRLLLAPPLVLDYLVAHEMAHLREMNHGPRFWALVRSLCPHVDEAEAWLKRHGAALHRYG